MQKAGNGRTLGLIDVYRLSRHLNMFKVQLFLFLHFLVLFIVEWHEMVEFRGIHRLLLIAFPLGFADCARPIALQADRDYCNCVLDLLFNVL